MATYKEKLAFNKKEAEVRAAAVKKAAAAKVESKKEKKESK
jgi:hypothetical protein|tara:strand:+ start:546 stop:668 length:123 start_codon:yes stop_codon:yes gene_type:complete